ncbi:hypothetical protein [Streptobacillus notomytis]|uniref:hypothetical protein n=1 Tax=Streptobacillus notomytis TaxID=1712031 RepID=UPI000935B699|nr:hypothetical protein [Streptobacillus notomytis]
MKRLLSLIILLIWGGLISFSNNITGPRHRVEVSAGFINDRQNAAMGSNIFISNSISYIPEWKVQINKKFDVTFGPKVFLNFSNFITLSNGAAKASSSVGSSPATITPSLILGGELDFNYMVKENLKIYTGLEVGTGIGFQISTTGPSVQNPEFRTSSKISLGFKINEKYNIAIYTADIKGLLGLEAGYTF